MSSYAVAWWIVGVAGCAGAACIWVALRRYRTFAPVLAALVVAWSVTPFQFDGQHMAPAFVVLFFRTFLEADGDVTGALTVLVISTVVVLLGFLGLYSVRKLTRPRASS
mgnify:CR=1 FL=1